MPRFRGFFFAGFRAKAEDSPGLGRDFPALPIFKISLSKDLGINQRIFPVFLKHINCMAMRLLLMLSGTPSMGKGKRNPAFRCFFLSCCFQ
ncbi:hypothetical protein [Bordetella trematum]|uniref:hypothetical protein n=1 Tax=Bordetella trematum TaxID=123899 RepID=UPI000F63937B|nr:hypothetical protein [Bordetella trematum]